MVATAEAWGVEPKDAARWGEADVAPHILGQTTVGAHVEVPLDWAKLCAYRLQALRQDLQRSYVGLDDIIDWLLASVVARENALLLGPPGVAKSELAVRLYKLLGLAEAEVDEEGLKASLAGSGTPQATRERWLGRERLERRNQKYFHYLLSRYTEPEELFGPIEISLLREGILARVNFGLLTGPGVRAAFIDETFKASSSVLNTLLTLTQERQYFNWGGMVNSDLLLFIGASNEMPAGFIRGTIGQTSQSDDFPTLHAFIDRFPLRLQVPEMLGTTDEDPMESELGRATWEALRREARRFVTGALFEGRQPTSDMPSINDVLLLGRCCLQHRAPAPSKSGQNPPPLPGIFRTDAVQRFERAFFAMGSSLQEEQRGSQGLGPRWTISPRKLKALYKIALAHALITDGKFPTAGNTLVQDPGRAQLGVFTLIWDGLEAQAVLRSRVDQLTPDLGM
jgi:MoxR-like ATPase